MRWQSETARRRVHDFLEIGGHGDVGEVENPGHLLFVVVRLLTVSLVIKMVLGESAFQ